jgi:hypothetical protein
MKQLAAPFKERSSHLHKGAGTDKPARKNVNLEKKNA